MKELSVKTGEIYESLEDSPVERLPYLVLKCLQAAKKTNGDSYSSGTLHNFFNGLHNILANRENDPVNIKLDPRFKKVNDMLSLKATLSAAEGKGPGCMAKRPVTPEHLGIAIDAGTIGRDSPKPLAVIGWGCRTGAECHMIVNEDLLFGPINVDNGVYDWIELSERVTKTRKGNPGDERELAPKIFPDNEYSQTCYVRTVMEYMKRKTPAQQHQKAPYFLNVHQKACKSPQEYQYWYCWHWS